MISQWFEKIWYSAEKPNLLLRICSVLYLGGITVRRWLYEYGILPVHHFPVPVIVVGNISVGGTGKTPLVIHIAQLLIERGYKPGIVSRGYGGKAKGPIEVNETSEPNVVGDEPVVMARAMAEFLKRRAEFSKVQNFSEEPYFSEQPFSCSIGCPIVVGKNRPKAVEWLLNHHKVTHIISDDGLQHYALARTLEIAVINGVRRFGNGYCLPAGPLREPKSRLKSVDLKITQGMGDNHEGCAIVEVDEYDMVPVLKEIKNKFNENLKVKMCSNSNMNDNPVCAVAGIAHPERFFKMMIANGFNIIPMAFPDHHTYTKNDFLQSDKYPIVMTEKDWVKCHLFAKENYFVARIKLKVNPLFDARLLLLLDAENQYSESKRLGTQKFEKLETQKLEKVEAQKLKNESTLGENSHG